MSPITTTALLRKNQLYEYMNTILIINDGTAEAEHAARFALCIARHAQADILLANTGKIKTTVKVLTNGDIESRPCRQVFESLTESIKAHAGFRPNISELDVSAMKEQQLAESINKQGTMMIVKGMPCGSSENAPESALNIHTVLNRVLCPLLLVPAAWRIKDIERMVYITDLRYCRPSIVKFMTQLGSSFGAAVSVAHLSACGLPHIAESYGNDLFEKQIRSTAAYQSLYFNNIRERDLSKALDVLINGMHNDILAFVNHRYHFEEIIGRYIEHTLPENITVPVMIFPY